MPDPKEPNLFLTWSGERSGAVARALRDWLPQVVQQCRPWMSEKDIYAGKRWRGEIRRRLDAIRVGILCLTPENVEKPWVNFEAGALSRSIEDDNRVIPYCFGFKPTDYSDPIGDFQGVEADQDGTRKLVESINTAMPEPLGDRVLAKVFDRAYDDLRSALAGIAPDAPEAPPKRKTEEMVEEILNRVRQLERGVDEIASAVDGYPIVETPIGGPQGSTGSVVVNRFWPRTTFTVSGATGPTGPTGFPSLGLFKKVDPDPEKP